MPDPKEKAPAARPGRPRLYDWPKLLGRKYPGKAKTYHRRYKFGVDFRCSPEVFKTQLKKAAGVLGMRVSVPKSIDPAEVVAAITPAEGGGS
ncbi:MAG: hypothetical protein ACRC7O_06220 [Fimbriiglobus sp.]